MTGRSKIWEMRLRNTSNPTCAFHNKGQMISFRGSVRSCWGPCLRRVIHYRFRMYDSGEINGFSLTGGRVYISRKLIAAVKNEDEIAGVLAHEIGHLATHQTAIELTRSFRIRLGITQVGDRADIFAKVHLFFSTPAKSNEEQDSGSKDELVADHVGMYAWCKRVMRRRA